MRSSHGGALIIGRSPLARQPLRSVALACALAAFGTRASAQDWIAGAFAGAAHTQAADVRVVGPDTDLTFTRVAFDARSFESPIYYGYRLSRRVPRARTWWIEAELIHLKLYARVDRPLSRAGRLDGQRVDRVPMRDLVQRFSISHGLNLVLANVARRQWLGQARRVAITARGGAGLTVPHGETDVRHEVREGYAIGGLGVQLGGGLDVRVRRHLLATFEYKFTRAAPSIDAASDARLRTDAVSHHAAFGLAFDW